MKSLVDVAREIVLSHAISDIKYSTILEMAWDRLDLSNLTYKEQDDILEKLDALVRKAKVTVTFED